MTIKSKQPQFPNPKQWERLYIEKVTTEDDD
jgi:hypothetical protein